MSVLREGQVAYETALRRALEDRGLPGEIGAAFRSAHLEAPGDRVAACMRVRAAQAVAHRAVVNPRPS